MHAYTYELHYWEDISVYYIPKVLPIRPQLPPNPWLPSTVSCGRVKTTPCAGLCPDVENGPPVGRAAQGLGLSPHLVIFPLILTWHRL